VLLDGVEKDLTGSCIGELSEIYDGEPPRMPRCARSATNCSLC
jgi:hypothetical protein